MIFNLNKNQSKILILIEKKLYIRCTQADHKNQQIIGFCIDSTCPNQRPYCHFCLFQHGYHLDKLTAQELLSEWIQERILVAQNVEKNDQECKITLDSHINVFLPYHSFNIQQFPELGLSQIDQLIKGLCQIRNCEEKLFKQLNQSIEQIKSIVDEILKNQTNIKNNDNLQIQHYQLDKQLLEQPEHIYILQPNLNPFSFDPMNQIQLDKMNGVVLLLLIKIIQSWQLDVIRILKYFSIYKGN